MFDLRWGAVALLLAAVLPVSSCLGAEGDKIPAIELPKALQPYVDETKVVTSNS